MGAFWFDSEYLDILSPEPGEFDNLSKSVIQTSTRPLLNGVVVFYF